VALLVGMVVYFVAGVAYMMKNGTGDGLGIFDLSQDAIWAANGIGGMFDGFLLSMPLMSMYTTLLFYGPIAENPKKDIPLAMYIAMILVGVIWIGTTVVTANVLPVEQVAGQPLTVIAQITMPALAIPFVIFGPLMAILTTYIGNTPASMEAAARMVSGETVTFFTS